jgi:hypothetical protein
MDPTEELGRMVVEEMCPICTQKFTNIEDHISKDYAAGLDVGFVKWLMQIHKDLGRIKRIEAGPV